MGEKACVHFDGSKEGLWTFLFEDGSSVERSSFAIPCTLVGYVEMQCQSIEEDGEKCIEEKWIRCSWDFIKYRFCPIKIEDKWGFIDCRFNIVCKPQFSFVGGIAGPYWDSALVCRWDYDIATVWFGNEFKFRKFLTCQF